MTTPPTPCQSVDVDLWFSDDPAEQRVAAQLCEGCPLGQYTKCREEGWNHPHGVWGGLTEAMRKRMDRKRYAAAEAASVLHSLEIDDIVLDRNADIEAKRLADAAASGRYETVFEVDGPDSADVLAIGAA